MRLRHCGCPGDFRIAFFVDRAVGRDAAHFLRFCFVCPNGPDCLWPLGCSGRRRPRPPARLGPHFVRRRASKPARALRTLRRPPHQWGRVADRRVVSKPGQAPPPPTSTAARPTSPNGALHTSSQTVQNSPSTARMHPRTRKKSPSALKTAQNEWFLSSRANFFTEVPLKGQRWANFVSAQAGTDLLGP